MTPAQAKVVWGMVGKLQKTYGLSKEDAEELLRDLTEHVSGQRSTRALSTPQASQVIEQLKARLHALELKSHDMISPEQQKMLGWLVEALGLHARAYRALCRRVIKVWCPQKRDEAVAMHECMESMLRRRVGVEELVTALKAEPMSTEDRKFVASTASTSRGRLAISSLVILVKIGRRYGVVRDTDETLSDDEGGDRADERQCGDGKTAAVRRDSDGSQSARTMAGASGQLIELRTRRGGSTSATPRQEHVYADGGGTAVGTVPHPHHSPGALRPAPDD